MKCNEVLKVLGVSRPTLTKYVKEGRIKVELKVNNQYEYDRDDVYKLLRKGIPRKTCIYARVSTHKQKSDLENQINILETFCINSGWQINSIYKDVADGISFEKRGEFFTMLDDIMKGNVERVVINYKDRLGRVGFDLFNHLFKKFDTEIIIVSEVGSEKLDSEEISEEIISVLHCYNKKLYTNRSIQKLKEAFENDK